MKFLFKLIGLRKVIGLLVIVTVLSLLDLIGLAIIFPYLKMITDAEEVYRIKLLHLAYEYLKFESRVTFLYAISAMVALIFSVKAILVIQLNKIQSQKMAGITRRLSGILFGLLMNAKYSFFLKRSPSELMGMNYSYSSQSVICLKVWLGIVSELIFFAFVILTALFIDPIITIYTALIVGIFAFIFYKSVISRVLLYGEAQEKIDIAMHSLNFATISSIKDIKIMDLGEMFYKRTEDLAKRTMDINWRFTLISIYPRITIEYCIIITILIFSIVFILPGFNTEVMIPYVGLIAVTAVRLVPALGRLTGYYSSYKYSMNYLQKFEEFYSSLCESSQKIKNIPSKFINKLVIKSLMFSYGEKLILNNIDMTIQHGWSVGIVGPSGSGKSTLLDVLTGLQEKQSGRFLLDDVELDPYYTNSLRQHIGYVPQTIALINESIAFNITFSHSFDEDLLYEVIKSANLTQFVESLEQGVYTSVGESGIKLSGGQKQRIGIARALYRKPKILVFDESTSALDNITEKELTKEISSMKGIKTLIIVAHRITTVMECDLIYVLAAGQIVASGTHNQLLKSCDLYKNMNYVGIAKKEDNLA